MLPTIKSHILGKDCTTPRLALTAACKIEGNNAFLQDDSLAHIESVDVDTSMKIQVAELTAQVGETFFKETQSLNIMCLEFSDKDRQGFSKMKMGTFCSAYNTMGQPQCFSGQKYGQIAGMCSSKPTPTWVTRGGNSQNSCGGRNAVHQVQNDGIGSRKRSRQRTTMSSSLMFLAIFMLILIRQWCHICF